MQGAGGRESAGRGRGGARLAPPLHHLTFFFNIRFLTFQLQRLRKASLSQQPAVQGSGSQPAASCRPGVEAAASGPP